MNVYTFMLVEELRLTMRIQKEHTSYTTSLITVTESMSSVKALQFMLKLLLHRPCEIHMS